MAALLLLARETKVPDAESRALTPCYSAFLKRFRSSFLGVPPSAPVLHRRSRHFTSRNSGCSSSRQKQRSSSSNNRNVDVARPNKMREPATRALRAPASSVCLPLDSSSLEGCCPRDGIGQLYCSPPPSQSHFPLLPTSDSESCFSFLESGPASSEHGE